MEIIKAEEILGHKITIYTENDNKDFFINANELAVIIENKNVSQMLKNIDEDEKVLKTITRENGSTFKQWYLTEDGVYEVLMLSKKSIAKEFKKQVKKILKSVRLDGGYIYVKESDNEKIIEERINNLLIKVKKELEIKNQKLLDYDRFFLEDKECVSINFLAEKYEMSREKLIQKLINLKFIYKKGKNIYLYREHKYKNYAKYYKSKNKHIIKFTILGQLQIDKLMKNGENNIEDKI